MLSGVQIKTYTTVHTTSSNTFFLTLSTSYTHLHLHICYLLPKNGPKQVTEKHFAKKCKNKSRRDVLPPKTLPKKPMKQATMHTTMHAQTSYSHITVQCICRVATIPTSFQPHPPQSIPHPHTQLHTQYFLQHTQPSTF